MDLDFDKLRSKAEQEVEKLCIENMRDYGIGIDRFNYNFITGYPMTQFLPPVKDEKEKNDIFNNLESNKISSLYIHIPFCTGSCTYCYFYKECPQISQRKNKIDNYLQYLEKEAQIIKDRFGKLKLSSLYIGGGTPSLLTKEQLKKLFNEIIRNNFELTDNAEISFEAHPVNLTEDKILSLKELGVNRISFGVQTFEDKLLKKLDRRHTKNDIIKAITNIKNANFENWSIDLMYGFPGQTLNNIFNDLQMIKEYDIPAVAVYRLEIDRRTRIWREEKIFNFPKEEELLKMLAFIFEGMKDIGYEQDKVNWFVKYDKYKYKQQDYKWNNNYFLGLGPSSYFYVNNYYCQNSSDINTYFEKLDKNNLPIEKAYKLDHFEQMRRAMVLGIKLTEGVKIDEFKQKYGKDPKNVFYETLEKLKTLKLIEMDETHIKLTSKGYYFADAISEEFFSDRYKNDLKTIRENIFKSYI